QGLRRRLLLASLLGLRGLPFGDQAHPFGKGNLVAVVEPQEVVLHAGAGGRLFGPLHVFRRRRVAVSRGSPGTRRRGAGRFQVLEHGRPRVRGVERTQSKGGVELGVLAAVVILLAEGQPAAEAKRLRWLLADRRRLLQLLQDRVDFFLRRDRLLAFAGI